MTHSCKQQQIIAMLIIGLWKILDKILLNGSIAEPVHQLHYVGCQNWHLAWELNRPGLLAHCMPAFLAGCIFSVDSTGFSQSHEFNFLQEQGAISAHTQWVFELGLLLLY